MGENNKQSINVLHIDMLNNIKTIALWIAEEPLIIMPYLNEVARDLALDQFPNYLTIHKEIFVKVTNINSR